MNALHREDMRNAAGCSIRCLVATGARCQADAEDHRLSPQVRDAGWSVDHGEGSFSLPRVVDFLESTLGDHAAPAVRRGGFVNLEGDPRLGAHQVELATGTGMGVDRIAVIAICKRNEVGPAVPGLTVTAAGDSTHDRGSQQFFDSLRG